MMDTVANVLLLICMFCFTFVACVGAGWVFLQTLNSLEGAWEWALWEKNKEIEELERDVKYLREQIEKEKGR